MSHYPGAYQDPFAQPGQMQAPARMSGLALTSFIFSLVFCCPCTTIPGAIMGLIAVFTIGSNPMKKGRGLAVAAVIIGVLGTALQIGVVVWGRAKIMEITVSQPTQALQAGYANNPAGFRAEFYGPGASAGDEEVKAFIADLQGRYGKFNSISLDDGGQRPQRSLKPGIIDMPCMFTFEKHVVGGTVTAVIFDEKTEQFVWRIQSITIHDPSLGDRTFPDPAANRGTAAPATAP